MLQRILNITGCWREERETKGDRSGFGGEEKKKEEEEEEEEKGGSVQTEMRISMDVCPCVTMHPPTVVLIERMQPYAYPGS